jgi:hypothetical protein
MAGYEILKVGDATEISTLPEKVPAPWLLVAIPGTLLVLIALSMGFLFGVVAAGFVYGAMYLLMHSKQATQYRLPAKFRVSKSGIDVAGNNIPKDAIQPRVESGGGRDCGGESESEQRAAECGGGDELGD